MKSLIMKKLILFILCFGFPFSIWADYTNMIVEHYSVEQGLPNNVVNCTLKDRDGFIWFGTWYGLCRFDGVKFHTYNKPGENGSDLPPRKIQRMVEDKQGNIWVKTIDRKLYVFNRQTECFHTVYDDMKNYAGNIQIIKMQTTSDGNILLLTKDKNLLLAEMTDKGQVNIRILFDARDVINPRDYRLRKNVLTETEDYICWVGSEYKIGAFRKGEILHTRPMDFVTSKMSIGAGTEYTAVYAQEELLWVGDNHGIFYCIDTRTGTVNRYELSDIKGAITNLLALPSGNIYLSVLGQGTYEYHFGERRLQRINVPLSEEYVTYACIDRYEKLWFYENERTLVYYDPLNHISKRFPFKIGPKLGSLYLEDVGEKGMFFLLPDGEAWLFNREHLSMLPFAAMKQVADAQENQKFLHIFQDTDGVLWMASSTQGVYRLNFPKKQFGLMTLPALSHADQQDMPGVRALYQTKNGDIWVGTRWQHVYLLDKNGEVKHVFAGNGPHRIGVAYHFMEDNKGNLWISTKGDGLLKAVPDANSPGGFRFTRFRHQVADVSSLSGNDVYFTYQDSRGRIWVGMLDGGLALMEEVGGKTVFRHKYNGFKHYPGHGLYMEVRNMIEDKDGRMWVGTMDGLISFDNDFKEVEQIEFETYRNGNRMTLACSDVYALYSDHHSQLWVSVFGGGVSWMTGYNRELKQPIFKSYGMREGLNNDVVFSLLEDNENRLWFVTEGGLACFDSERKYIRNFNKYDGFPTVQMEENALMKTVEGKLWIGCKQGILVFDPHALETTRVNYNTYIVDCRISNKDVRDFSNPAIAKQSITYTDRIVLKHNQAMFTFEFAALNYVNQNRVSYRYILEGYEKEWHYDGKNRMASYTNVPAGTYVFKVQTLDEANSELSSMRTLTVEILPPWWATGWAYAVYIVLGALLLFVAVKLSLFMIKVKNDVYIGQKLAELKIKFFTNISHELRTPLTLIQGPIQELKEKETLSEKGMLYIDLMEKNTKQMLQLVNQILDFRKIQNGKMRLHISCFSLRGLLMVFEREFRMLAEEKEVDFMFQYPDEDIQVWADKEKLGIVVRNILSNAFKFTPSGGSVFVTAGLKEDGRHCYLRVEDTGIGIPQNKLTEIFERFSQAENAREAYYQGTGIGLALSKEIINLHHGEVYAETPEKQGTCFVVELQLGKEHYTPGEVDFYVGADDVDVSAEEEREYEDTEPAKDTSLPNLLIVDDNKDLCNMLKLQLEEKYNVYLAYDGVEGMKKVYLYHPDIVVTDQMMPNMDGLEMLRHIRKDFQISHIPVIILTAKGDDEAKTEAISKGANAYITKPFNKDYLIARIEQLLKDRKLFRERVWQYTEQQNATDNYEQYLVKKDVEFIEKIHQVVEENMDNSEFNIDTIASTIGLSRSAFFKKLKSLTGLAPVDLVKEIRLNKSVELIKNTDMGVSEIAFTVGFKDSGYFSKCFRKKYGQTPREYINSWRKV